MKIVEGMSWPPMDFLAWKMQEHSAWYSGDAEVLANFYNMYIQNNILNMPYPLKDREMFWGRQIKNQGEIFVHVPMAGDIAETSANFLFSESPIIKIAQAHEKTASQGFKDSQDDLDKMLLETSFSSRILEGAETCAAIGGVYIKLAWDEELSPHPIPVIVQADRALPEFKFGILTAVTFWKTIDADDSGSKVYRLLERYEKGSISYKLYLGTTDKLGKEVPLTKHDETKGMDKEIQTIDELLVVYVPNMLPNRLDRSSSLGKSDLQGIEGLMDSLDEIFSSWVRDIALAQAKILLPQGYLKNSGGKLRYNMDQMLYVELDIDPLTEGNKITPQQFEIRAESFEKSALNFMERIITSAGYSPQSFGLNISGRAESGTALSIRERKSFATKGKKENYWQQAIKRIITLMTLIENEELNGAFEPDLEINVAFNDSITNNLTELSTSVKMLSDALAASTETKVRLIHPDWNEAQIEEEVQKIMDENGIGATPPAPDGSNLDLSQMNLDGTSKTPPAVPGKEVIDDGNKDGFKPKAPGADK